MANGGRIDFTVGYKLDKTGLNEIKKSFEEIKKMTASDFMKINNYSGTKGQQLAQANKDAIQLKNTMHEVEKAFQNAFNPTTGITNIKTLNTSLKQIGIDRISTSFANAGEAGNKAFYQITKGALTTTMQLKQSNKVLDQMAITLGNTIKWGISSSIMNKFIGSVQQAYGYVQHLDTSLNDIRIVTGKSADEMERFAEKANNSAKALGQSTTAYTEAALIYYQQGLSDEEAQARAETTLKAANVTGQSGREVSEQLTAVWNGYKVTAEETEMYVDKLAAVAASTASDLEELSTGMSKVASAANNMGVDIDQLNAQLATIISVTRQAPETAGTALKTIYARMEDLKISGEDEDGVKLGEVSSTLEAVGVSVMDTSGDLRDLGEVIEEVASKWDTWTSAQQNAIAQALAGKRQYNNLLALFDNWDMYTEALNTSKNSLGTLQQQQDIYMESTAAHLQALKTQAEDFYDSLINTKDVNTALDGITKLVKGLTNFLDGIGQGRNALLMFGSTAVSIFSKQIGQAIAMSINNLKIFRENAQQMQAQLDNIKLFEQSQQYQNYAPVKVLVDSLKEASQYYQYLSNDQIESINALAQERAEAELLENQWEENTLALEKYFNAEKQNNSTGHLKGAGVFDVNNPNLTTNMSLSIQKDATEFKDLGQNIRESKKEAEELINLLATKSLDPSIKNVEKYQNALKIVMQEANRMKQVFEDLGDKGIFDNLSEKDAKQLESSLKKINSMRPDKIIEGYEELTVIFEKLSPVAQEAFKKLGITVEVAGDKMDVAKIKAKNFYDTIKTAEIQRFSQQITQGIASVGQFASALNSLKSGFSALGDENLSTSDKITQFVSGTSMGITMLITSMRGLGEGLQAFSNGSHILNEFMLQFTGMIPLQEAVNTLSTEYQTKLLEEAAAQGINTEGKIENIAALSAEEKEKLLNIAVSKGYVSAEEAEKIATDAENVSLAFKAKLLDTLKAKIMAINPYIAATIAIITLLTAAIAAYDRVQKNAAKHNLEDAEANLESAKKNAEAASEELDNVKKLVDAYKELKQEYGSDQIETLRRKIYELSQEYNVHINMVQLMSANYEELDILMNQLLKDISGKKTAAELEAVNAELDALAAKMENIQAENSHPFLDFWMTCQNLAYNIAEKVADIIEDLTGFRPPEWLTELVGVAWGGGGAAIGATNRRLVREGGKNVQGVFSVNRSGQLEFDEKKFESYNKDQQEEVKQWLRQQYTENSSIIEGLGVKALQLIDHSAENIEKAISGTESERQQYQTDKEGYKTTAAEDAYTQLYGDTDIGNAYSYNKAKEAIANKLVEDLEITKEEALDLAVEQLDKKASYDVKAAGAISEAFVGKNASKIESQYANSSTAEQSFISKNVELAATFPDIEAFKKEYHDWIDEENRQQEIISIGIALTNTDGSEFKPEDIQALFANGDLNGKTQEEFESETYEQQVADLVAYYTQANQLENDFQANKKQGLIDEQQQKINQLDTERKELDEIANSVIDKYQTLNEEDKSFFDEDKIQNLKHGFESIKESVSNNFEGSYGSELVDEDSLDLINKYLDGTEDLTEAEQTYINALKDMYHVDDEGLAKLLDKISAYDDFQEELQKSGKQCKSYSKSVKDLTNKQNALQKSSDNLKDSVNEVDWNAYKKGVQAMKKGTDSAIDSLQGAYSSLTSIMEEYNSTQTLSMDNLQALLNMDTAYLSALQIENGQMTLNEDALKKIALAKLDEAEAEAYAQAMEELHNDETRRSIEMAGQASITIQQMGNVAMSAGQAAASGAAGWRQYWKAVLNQEGVADDAYSQQVGAALQTKLQAINAVRDQIKAGNFGTTMKGPSSAGAGSGSDSSKTEEADHEDYLEREADIYKTINEELDQIEATLGRIQTVADHKWGIDAQKALEKENQLLDKQLEKLEEKKALQQQDLSARRGVLESIGVNFSEDGSAMLNSESVLDAMYANYNSMVDAYNNMSKAEQETYKAQLEAEQKRIEDIESKIDDYESGFSDYQDTLDKLLDAHYAQIENEVKLFNNMVDVHLELNDARKEWDKFWSEVVEDVQDNDFAGQIAASMKQLKTLVGLGGDVKESDVYTLTQHLMDTTTQVNAQIASANRGGEDSIFGDDTALSKETLQNYIQQLMDAVTAAKEALDNMAENYLKILDDAQDKIDKQIEGWESINDHLEHNLELIKLISGEKAFDAIDNQLEKQYENNLNLLTTQKASQDFWAGEVKRYETLMASVDKNSKQYQTYEEAYNKSVENYRKAVSDLDKTVETSIKNLQDWRKNAVDNVMDTLDKAMSKGMGLDNMEKQWKLINDYASKYLDNVERALGMEEYTNVLDEAVNATGLTAANQEKLNNFREIELAQLNQKNKLTQFDLDESKARLEILKQQMALEDARNNKSNMRLRRDSQGNYTYQYTGDQEVEDQAENGLLTARREWYELVKARNKETRDDILAMEQQYQDNLRAMDEARLNNDIATLNALEEANKMLLEEIQFGYEQAETAKRDLFQGTAQFFTDVEDAEILPMWEATIEEMVNEWSGDGEESFIGACTKAIQDLETVQDNYVTRTHQVLNTAGVDYNKLKEQGIDPTDESLKDLVMDNEDFAIVLEEVNGLLTEQEGYLRDAEAAYNDLEAAAISALTSAQAALVTLSQTAIQTVQDIQAAISAADAAYSYGSSTLGSLGSSSGGGGGDFTGGPGNTSNTPKINVYKEGQTYGNYYYAHYNGKKYTTTADNPTDAMSQILDQIRKENPSFSGASDYTPAGNGNLYGGLSLQERIKRRRAQNNKWSAWGGSQWNLNGVNTNRWSLNGYATGGYTGDWDQGIPGTDNGRLAILHQKELVLNADDTSNMLKAVEVVRQLFSGNIITEIAKSLLNVGNSGLLGEVSSSLHNMGSHIENSSTANNSNITINADFSGVHDADEIYEAFTQLQNTALQSNFSTAPHLNISY